MNPGWVVQLLLPLRNVRSGTLVGSRNLYRNIYMTRPRSGRVMDTMCAKRFSQPPPASVSVVRSLESIRKRG